METKRVTENFQERNTPYSNPDTIRAILNDIERIFEQCDEKLTGVELQLSGYESQSQKR